MKKASPYSKMYLVPPGVYQKLLNCISEKDKIVTDGLNLPETPAEKTPTEKIMEEISNQDLVEPPASEQQIIQQP